MKKAAEAWLKQAKEDIKYAQSAFGDGYFGWACFACQQAAEKALKAFLVEKEFTFPRTHRLLALVEEAEKASPSLTDLRPLLDVLNQYYGATRYADLHAEKAPYEHFTEDLTREALDFAHRVVTAISEEIEQ